MLAILRRILLNLYQFYIRVSKASRLIFVIKNYERPRGQIYLQCKFYSLNSEVLICKFQRLGCMKQLHTVQNIDSDDDDLKIPAPDFKYFYFPILERLPQYFSSLEELNKTLDISLRNYNQSVSPANRIEKTLVIRLNDGWITFKCKVFGCQAFLQFENEGTGLRLTKSSVEHKHFVRYGKNGKGRTPKIKNFEVEECLDQLQLLNFKPKQIEVFVRQRFKINAHSISAIKGIRNRKEIIKNLLECLSRIDNFKFECKDIHQIMAYYMKQSYNRQEKRQERDVIIVVSQKMKALYQNYHGEYVFFSIFPDFVLETRYTRKLKYQHMGVFYGEDTSNSLTLLFGIVYMRRPVRYAYLYILQKLFTFLGRYPKVLVTDYDPALMQAFKRLQKRYCSTGVLKLHLQLPNSFISNCFNLRSSPQFIAALSNQLQGLLRQPDKKRHAARLKKIIDTCSVNPEPTQDRIAEQVERYVSENSFINIQPLFIGLTMTSYSTASLLRTRVLDFFKSPRPTVLALKAFLQIFKAYQILKYVDKEEVNARINPPKESMSSMKIDMLHSLSRNLDPNIKLRHIIRTLSTSAAQCFADSLEQCFKGQVNLVESRQSYYYKVQQGEDYPYVIKKVIEAIDGCAVKIWRCECKYYIKVGIPCWHQLKVCLIEKCDMTPQINPFWMKTALLPVHQRVRNEHDVKNWADHEQNPPIQLQQKMSERGMAKLDEVIKNMKPFDFTSNNPVEEEYNHWNDDLRQSDKSSEANNYKQKEEPIVFDVDNQDCIILERNPNEDESLLKEQDILDSQLLQADNLLQNNENNEVEEKQQQIRDEQIEQLIQGIDNMSNQEQSEQIQWSKGEDEIKYQITNKEM